MNDFKKLIPLIGFTLMLSLNSAADTVSCTAEKRYTGRGWLPKYFEIELTADRSRGDIIEPKRQQFGQVPFEKSFVGSSMWARGKGTVTRGSQKGTFYNYTLQLDFKEGESEALVKMAMHGYHDVVQKYNCRSGSRVISQPEPRATQPPPTPNVPKPSGNSSSFATLWEKNGGEILGKQGRSPDIESTPAQTVQPNNPTIQPPLRPQIVKIDPRVEGKNGLIQFTIQNQQSVQRVFVNDTDLSAQGPDYFWSGYIPLGESTIEIKVISRSGITVKQAVQLVRSTDTLVAKRNLPPIDPTNGLKANLAKETLAIIIGIDEYETLGSATFADRDASLFFDVAQENFGINATNIKFLLNEEATRLNLLEAFRDWARYKNQSGTADIVLFFAGHGRTDDRGETSYLLPHNVRSSLIEESALGLNTVLETLADSTSGQIIAFVDACYSGGSRTGESLVAGRPLIVVQKQTLTRENVTLFSASGEQQIAKVIDEIKHGAFSYALMRALTGEGDIDNDGKVTSSELSTFITEFVTRNVKDQNPELKGANWALNFK